VLYRFLPEADGNQPRGGVIFDSAGNLYGTTAYFFPGDFSGTVFQLTPSGSGWAETILFMFDDLSGTLGTVPVAGLTFDNSGNLYGATSYGGGSAFQGTLSGGSYTFSLMTNLGSGNGQACGPQSSLIMDSAGKFYGTTYCDGANGLGSVFKISPAGSGWTVTNLHDFAGGDDGQYPVGGVAMDSSGNLYGTTSQGGTGTACGSGCGVVWEITP
jgi:uncharacterized repeat protein (TIGR03803 family)